MAWKVCAAVVNFRLKRGFVLHDALHGLRLLWGTRTATIKSKLDQQLARISHKPLFKIFLDIRMAYDSVDRCQ